MLLSIVVIYTFYNCSDISLSCVILQWESQGDAGWSIFANRTTRCTKAELPQEFIYRWTCNIGQGGIMYVYCMTAEQLIVNGLQILVTGLVWYFCYPTVHYHRMRLFDWEVGNPVMSFTDSLLLIFVVSRGTLNTNIYHFLPSFFSFNSISDNNNSYDCEYAVLLDLQ